jgi:hypothetical protein
VLAHGSYCYIQKTRRLLRSQDSAAALKVEVSLIGLSNRILSQTQSSRLGFRPDPPVLVSVTATWERVSAGPRLQEVPVVISGIQNILQRLLINAVRITRWGKSMQT